MCNIWRRKGAFSLACWLEVPFRRRERLRVLVPLRSTDESYSPSQRRAICSNFSSCGIWRQPDSVGNKCSGKNEGHLPSFPCVLCWIPLRVRHTEMFWPLIRPVCNQSCLWMELSRKFLHSSFSDSGHPKADYTQVLAGLFHVYGHTDGVPFRFDAFASAQCRLSRRSADSIVCSDLKNLPLGWAPLSFQFPESP